MDEWVGEWMNGGIDVWKDGWVGEQTNKQTNGMNDDV